jgi:hyperosmotically inducible periplasmic protein
MNRARRILPLFLTGFLTLAVGCQERQAKSPDVKDSVKKSLEQAGLRDVDVSQDRDKGVVTLSGTVSTDADRAQAESIAKSAAAGEIIANQISVRPPGEESRAKDVESALDKSIDKNVEALLIQHNWKNDVNYDVKQGVVTLKGKVNSQAKRTQIEKTVAAAPNVRQVVNEIDVTKQKATTSH